MDFLVSERCDLKENAFWLWMKNIFIYIMIENQYINWGPVVVG